MLELLTFCICFLNKDMIAMQIFDTSLEAKKQHIDYKMKINLACAMGWINTIRMSKTAAKKKGKNHTQSI